MDHIFRSDKLVKIFAGDIAQFNSGLLQSGVLFVRRLGNLGRFIVANVIVERGDQHQRLVQQFFDTFTVRFNPHDAVFREGDGDIAQKTHRLQDVTDNHRLEDVQFKMAVAAANAHTNIIAWIQVRISTNKERKRIE